MNLDVVRDVSNQWSIKSRHILSPVQLHATTLSCNAVMVTVLIKAMPVTIDHPTAITIMMKALALVSWDIALSIPFVHVSAHYVNEPFMMRTYSLEPNSSFN